MKGREPSGLHIVRNSWALRVSVLSSTNTFQAAQQNIGEDNEKVLRFPWLIQIIDVTRPYAADRELMPNAERLQSTGIGPTWKLSYQLDSLDW